MHFHVVPRMPDFGPDDVGPRVFHFLGATPEDEVTADESDRLAAALGPVIQRHLT